MHRRLPPLFALLPLCAALSAHAADVATGAGGEPVDERVALARVEVVGRHYDNAVGSGDAASQGTIRAELLKSRPAQRPGELLEFVPGVIVTQHSGDGKANQYFLRGFNLDHGTDFATSVLGMPVNMASHAHGQGYADLNFVIPELVERIAYRKGPYFASTGDFGAAGAADIAYRRALDAPFASATVGAHGYRRLLGAGSTALAGGQQLLGAVELQRNDGPWIVPERLRKSNAVLRLSGGSAADGYGIDLLSYDARWTATDQIPQRLVDAGRLDRFGSLDASDGGRTQRRSIAGEWHRRDAERDTAVSAYAIASRFELFSNFTYALERPAAGDQFAQQERRRTYGVAASHAVERDIGGRPARSEFGLQLRHDRIELGLHDTAARRIVATTREDRVRQTQLGFWAQNTIEWTPWLRSVAGLRVDHARFDARSLTLAENSGRAGATLVSPKLSLILGPWAKTELFVNAGRGFHSNDARGTVARIDPRSGAAVERVPGLVPARGLELGARTEWLPGLQSSMALWKLDTKSELVYVGDAGTTEANRPSRRHGIEWNNRWAPAPWLLVDADLAWSRARLRGDDPAGNRIPNAVDKVASGALSVHDSGPWSGSLQLRYLGSAPLIEDDSVRSRASLSTNLRIARRLTAKADLTLDVFNLFDRKLKDIEYFYESRLPGEAAAVADRHFHPAEPRSVRVTLRVEL